MAAQSFQLVMQKGPNPGKAYELTLDELTIGRDISNRIVINDPEISRKHTRLTLQGGAYVIEDLGSTNGTFVNGQRLMGPHLLRGGETVMLGEKISLVFEAPGYDRDATVVGSAPAAPPRETVRVGSTPDYSYAPPPPYQPAAPAYQSPPPYQATPEPMYSDQPLDPYAAAPVEAYEQQPYEAAPKRSSSRNLLLAGCGCLVIMLCCVVVAAFAFDYMNLYCEAPFDAIFACP